MHETFTAFSGLSLSQSLGESVKKAKNEVGREPAVTFSNVSPEDYVSRILDRFHAEPIVVDFGGFEIDVERRQIRGSDFPPIWNVEPTHYYEKPVYILYLPFTGSGDTLKYRPSILHMWQPKIFLEGQRIGFEILSFTDDADEIKKQRDYCFQMLKEQLVNTNRDINEYNHQVEKEVLAAVTVKLESIEKQEAIAAQLGGKRRTRMENMSKNEQDDSYGQSRLQHEQEPQPASDVELSEIMPDEEPIPLFISYTHDSGEHIDRVWTLCGRLVEDGIACTVDESVNGTPPEGWPRWMMKQVRNARFVLVICTANYLRRFLGEEEPGKGKGANWEGLVITNEMYESEGRNTKFIPIVFSDTDIDNIPMILRGATRYNLEKDSDYDKLYRYITGQPRRILPPLGRIRRLPPEPVPAAANKLDVRFAARFENILGPVMGTLRMFLRESGLEDAMEVFKTNPEDSPGSDYPDPSLADPIAAAFSQSTLRGPSNVTIGSDNLSWAVAYSREFAQLSSEAKDLLHTFPGRDETLTLVVEEVGTRAETLTSIISTSVHLPQLAHLYDDGVPAQQVEFLTYFFLTIMKALRVVRQITAA